MDDEDGKTTAAIVTEGAKEAMKQGVTTLATQGPEAALAAGGIGFLAGAGSKAVSMLITRWTKPWERIAEVVGVDEAAAIESMRPELEPRIEVLREEFNENELGSGTTAIFASWLLAWRSTPDDKKRRLLKAALPNAFDKKAYEEGLGVRLFKIMQDLDYGELYYLSRIAEHSEAFKEKARTIPANPDGLLADHLVRLSEARLIVARGLNRTRYDILDDPNIIKCTELGQRLAALIKDLPEDPEL